MSSTTDIHTPDLSANFNFEEKQYSDCKVVPARYPSHFHLSKPKAHCRQQAFEKEPPCHH